MYIEKITGSIQMENEKKGFFSRSFFSPGEVVIRQGIFYAKMMSELSEAFAGVSDHMPYDLEATILRIALSFVHSK
jgi:hypothetical protein